MKSDSFSGLTLGELQHQCVQRFSGRPFLTMAPRGETLSYDEFESRTNQIAHGLIDYLDVLPSHTAIMLENSPQYLAITYALKKIGSIEVSINRTFRGASLARTIKLTNTPVLITSSSHFEAVHAVIGELDNVAILMVLDGEEKAKELFPNQNIVSFETIPVENDSHICLLYISDAADE